MKKVKMKHKHSDIIINELKKTVPIYIVGMVTQIISFCISISIAKITGNILDLILQENVSNEQIMQEATKLLFLSAFIIVPNSIKRILYYVTARRSDKRIKREVYKKLQYVNENYYESIEKGKFLAYLTKEIGMIRKFLGGFCQYITNAFGVPIVIVFMSIGGLSFKLAMILFFIVLITWFIMWRLYNKKKIKVEEARKEYVQLSNIIEQNTSNFTLVKLYNNQEEQKSLFNKENNEMRDKDFAVGKIDMAIDNVINFSEGICYIIIMCYGVFMIMQGQLSIGALSAFTAFINKIYSALKKNVQHITDGIVYFKQATNRIDQIMNLGTYQEKENNRLQKIQEINSIRVHNLNYKYPNSKKYAIKNLNFEINKNEKIGIIGMFGSGKTTLMNIITGLYEVGENQVFINDIDITKINKYSLFHNISYILQIDTLLNDTIKNNITMENAYDGKSIINATNRADILEDIFQMEHEFEETIGERGVRLSGGQKQRISIARNLVTDRDFIIYDDTFSALDANTEKGVLENVIKDDGKTIIIIANKVTDVKDLDRIYLMIDGEFIDVGTHEKLLERNPLYQEMYEYEMKGVKIID